MIIPRTASLEERLQTCRRLHAESLAAPDAFWLREAGALDWVRAPDQAFQGELARGDVSWFSGGLLSPAWNAVDRHAAVEPDRPALVWARAEGDVRVWTYRMLRQESARMAQVLLAQGVRWGDRVVAYLPETPTLAVLSLGCARIGAVAAAVPAGAPGQLSRVLRTTRARVLVTADEAPRPGSTLPLWERVEEALEGLGRVEAVLVERRTGAGIQLVYGRDHDLGTALGRARPTCAVRPCDAEDPLLLTPTTEDAPPLVHAIGGYLLGAALSLREAAGIGPGARVLCTEGYAGPRADVAWGTWVLGGAVVVDERGDAPARARALGLTHVVGPRAALAAAGPAVEGVSLDGSEASVAPVWSADGGGMLAVRFGDLGGTALPGLEPVLLDGTGLRAAPGEPAELCVRRAWPGQPRSLEQDHARFLSQRLERFPGVFRTVQRCRQRDDGTLEQLGPAPASAPSNVFPFERPLGRA